MDNYSTQVTKTDCSIPDYEIPIADDYILNARKKLGNGAFGDIYYGRNTQTNEEVGIKLEPMHSKYPQLFYESKIYMMLQGGVGIPELFWCGTQGNYNIMIINLLGPSLEDTFNYCKRKFTLKTCLMIAHQIITRIEYVHGKGFIHRDIKPDNFLFGLEKKKHLLYIIDFGLAKRYLNLEDKKHIPYKDGKSLTGTARYASLNTHFGYEQSRRDDIESLGYMIVYFLKGELPWQGLKAKSMKEKYEKIMEKKLTTLIETLCKDLPLELISFMNYARTLSFDETPDYNLLKRIIQQICNNEKIVIDNNFDWIQKLNEKEKNKKAMNMFHSEEEKLVIKDPIASSSIKMKQNEVHIS